MINYSSIHQQNIPLNNALPQSHRPAESSLRNTYGSHSLASHQSSIGKKDSKQRNSSQKHKKSINKPMAFALGSEYGVGSDLSKGKSPLLRQSIPKLLQEMEQALQQHSRYSQQTSQLSSQIQNQNQNRNDQSSSSEISDKYPSRVSILKSGISVLTVSIPEDNLHLPKLETSIMEQILMLREQKITLLHELSLNTDENNEIQREIAKILKTRQKLNHRICNENIIQVSALKQRQIQILNPSSSRNKQWADKNTYFPAVQRYVQLKTNLTSLQQEEKENEQEYQQKLSNIFQQNTEIRKEFEKYQKMNRQLKTTELILKSDTYEQMIEEMQSKISTLQQQKSKLESEIDIEKYEEVTFLRQQNEKLIAQANRLLAKKKRMGEVTSIQGLKKIISLQESLKDEIFSQMRAFKKQHSILIKHNHTMKAALSQYQQKS